MTPFCKLQVDLSEWNYFLSVALTLKDIQGQINQVRGTEIGQGRSLKIDAIIGPKKNI